MVQAADLVQSRKIIPDLATWLQCFALYVAVLAKGNPQKVQELMAYQNDNCQSKPEIQMAIMGRI